MKRLILVTIILLTVTGLQAGPYHRHHPGWRPYAPVSYYPVYRNPYYTPYRYYRSYTPLIVSTRTTTTYPQNLVMVTVESIADDLAELKELNTLGIITDTDLERARKTLLNRVGMTVNPAAAPATGELLKQIRLLYDMQSSQLLTSKEFRREKNKLLALL
jgi:hypothetical protein